MHVQYRIPQEKLAFARTVLERVRDEQTRHGRVITIMENTNDAVLDIRCDSGDVLDSSEQVEFVAGMFGLDDEHLVI